MMRFNYSICVVLIALNLLLASLAVGQEVFISAIRARVSIFPLRSRH